MSLMVGIVGLPNVGKSTLFNALLKKQLALAANYPFATVEPNTGVVPVPDGRLAKLAEVIRSQRPEVSVRVGGSEGQPVSINPDIGNEGLAYKQLPPIVPATVTFVDIAGLVKGAHKGEGLGNKFLAHVREVQLMVLVVRAFEDAEVVETGSGDVKADLETLKLELIMKDSETVENQISKSKKQNDNLKFRMILDRLVEGFNQGKMAREILDGVEMAEVRDLFLLTAKPYLVVVNVDEQLLADKARSKKQEVKLIYAEKLGVETGDIEVISAKMEAEVAGLSQGEQRDYLSEYGLEESGLERLIGRAYEKLGLISFLTAGEKEVRAWTLRQGQTALEASGVIHTDFMKHFIKADVIEYSRFVEAWGWKRAREMGWVRSEGRDYVMQEGEVVEFRIGK